MTLLKKWMATATTPEQEDLAARAATSRAHLYQLASGTRQPSAELACRLDLAAQALQKINKKLPLLPRSALCLACGMCEYAKRCGK